LQRRDLLIASLALGLPAAIGTTTARRAWAAGLGTVNVAYAGSLVALMEHGIGPAFDKAFSQTGGNFAGYAGGSNKLAHEITGKLIQADVFISANPRVNDSLMGAAHGDWVDWFITFAQSPLVIGYNPGSRFAADFAHKPWYEVLQSPGIRIGRTDPKLDPKGRLTLALMKKAASLYKIPDLAERVLGLPENPAQVLPEETLVGRLQSGQVDVGFFYSTETANLKIPAITLPADVALSAHYTATIVNRAPNPKGAADFLAFLLGRSGQTIMRAYGLDLLPPKLHGDHAKVPAKVLALIP
jgi:molybdate/tungstate transport system substrate-binding protein